MWVTEAEGVQPGAGRGCWDVVMSVGLCPKVGAMGSLFLRHFGGPCVHRRVSRWQRTRTFALGRLWDSKGAWLYSGMTRLLLGPSKSGCAGGGSPQGSPSDGSRPSPRCSRSPNPRAPCPRSGDSDPGRGPHRNRNPEARAEKCDHFHSLLRLRYAVILT